MMTAAGVAAGQSALHVSRAPPARAASRVVCCAAPARGEAAKRASPMKGLVLSAAAVAAMWAPLAAHADIGDILPRFGSGDPIEQRKQLGQDVGKAVPPGGIYPLEDATLDNPNDSPRPADRSRQSQPFPSGADKGARQAQLNANRAAAPDEGLAVSSAE